MLDVARYGQYGGKLHLLCQGRYIYSTWTKWNLPFDCQWNGNNLANRTTWLHYQSQFHVLSGGLFETNISKHPLPWRMAYLYLTTMGFRQSYGSTYPWKQTHIRPTDCKSRHVGKPLQLAVICSRIHVEYNEQVGCYLFHSDMKLTIYSSGLSTSFCYHLLLVFHTIKSWIHNHLSEVAKDPKQADWWALHPIRHSFAHSKNTDTS